MMRKGWLATVGGILAAIGTLPTLATNLHLDLPLFWNDITGLLNLAGLLGLAVLGYVAKGADDHSTQQQITAASAQKEAEVMVKTADVVAPVEKVEVVKPMQNVRPAVKGIVIPKPPAKPKV